MLTRFTAVFGYLGRGSGASSILLACAGMTVVAGIVAAASRPAEAQFRYDLDNPRFDSFYRYRVELTHLPSNETVVVDAPFACWTSREIAVRQRAPYIVGTRIEATGEAVLVATPDVCDRRRPASELPPDYLPPVFWVPDGPTTEEIVGRRPAVPNDAGTIEFLIGYVSEAAYESPVSRFRFEGVTVDEIDKSAFERLRRELSQGSVFDLDEGFLREAANFRKAMSATSPA